MYKNYYERAYIETTKSFYKTRASEYLKNHGVIKYMQYADAKIFEEEIRCLRYLETCSVQVV